MKKLFPESTEGEWLLVDVEEMKQIVKSQSVNPDKTVILDTLATKKNGTASPRRLMRLISSRMASYDGNTPDGAWLKNAEAVLKICSRVDIVQDTNVIVYRFKVARASNTLIGLKEAGMKNVRLYMGLWNEWSRDMSLPITSL